MNKDCTSALYEIISQNGMPEECRHILLCIIGSTKTPDKLVVPDLFGGNEVGEDYTPQAKNLDIQLKDERLRTIQLVNIRSFYSNNFNNKNFGLKLCTGANPVSLFLVGGNSTGKSSIFSALEKHYTGMVSHARAINSNETSYMTFGFGQVKKLDVGYLVESESQVREWESLQTSKPNDITTSAFFCSDYDIERIEKSGENLNEFILEQLGYGDLFLLRQRIDYLLKRLKVNYDINKQELTSTEWAEIIEAFILLHSKTDLNEIKLFQNESNIEKAVLQGKRHDIFRSHWDMLVRGSASYINKKNVGIGYGDFFFSGITNDRHEPTSTERLAIMYQELFKRIEEKNEESKSIVDILDEMYMSKNAIFQKERENAEMPISSENRKEALTTVSTLIKDKCDQILSTIYEDSHYFIENILKRFSPNNETYHFNFEKGIVSMSIIVETEEGNFSAKPQEYLNTFRFKLYCVALKIALALSKMKERRISAPIVIDDIFNASDFENTLKLEQFVYTIFKTYDEVLQDKLPLQLILLTHDEMVQGAFRRGIKLRLEETTGSVQLFNNDTYRDHFLCGRLFDKEDWAEYIKGLKDTKDFDAQEFINLYLEN